MSNAGGPQSAHGIWNTSARVLEVAVAIGIVLASAACQGPGTPAEAPSENAASAPASAESTALAGKPCEVEGTVAAHGQAIEYCDPDASGVLIWVGHAAHEQAHAKALHAVEGRLAAQVEECKATEKKLGTQTKASRTLRTQLQRQVKLRKSLEQQLQDLKSRQRQAVPKQPLPSAPKSPPSAPYYKNCDAAREAGAAPLYKGDPGYGRHLDRDGDGVACEG